MLAPVALLVFLSAATGAGVVSADFVVTALDGLRCRRFISPVQGELGLWTRHHRGRRDARFRSFVPQGLHAKESLERIGLDTLHHAGEQIIAFFLILDQRILLAVAAQADAITKVIHPEQMVFPMM